MKIIIHHQKGQNNDIKNPGQQKVAQVIKKFRLGFTKFRLWRIAYCQS